MKIDKYYVQSQTCRNNDYTEHVRKRLDGFDLDDAREKRLKEHMCKYCYYMRGTIATQAIVEWECWCCEKKDHWGNGAYPKLCVECAVEHNLCRHCGADLDLREKRKKFNF